MKFICLGYLDEAKFADISPSQQRTWMEECLEYDDQLRRSGHFLGGEALQSPRNGVTLQACSGRIAVTDGPFAETKEQLGGILLLEARDLNHAIALISKHPGVRFGHWEIRPANEEVNALIAARGQAVREEGHAPARSSSC